MSFGLLKKYKSEYQVNKISQVKNSLIKLEKEFKELKKIEKHIQSVKTPRIYYTSTPYAYFPPKKCEKNPKK